MTKFLVETKMKDKRWCGEWNGTSLRLRKAQKDQNNAEFLADYIRFAKES